MSLDGLREGTDEKSVLSDRKNAPKQGLDSQLIQKDGTESVVINQSREALCFLGNEIFLDDMLNDAIVFSFSGVLPEEKKQISRYLLANKFKTGENPEIESKIQELSLRSWKLKYLLDNALLPPFKNNIGMLIHDLQKKEKELANILSSSKNEKSSTLDLWIDRIRTAATSLGQNFRLFINRASEGLKQLTESNQKSVMKMFSSIVEKKLLGKPYIRGSSGGKGFDCSGFISFLLREAGLLQQGMRETSNSLYKKSSRIFSYSEVKSGDLLFWGPMGGGHVEMIVGSPYQKNGEWVVDTVGSKRDGLRDPDAGVGYRTRKIRPKFQFGRYLKA